MLSSFAFLKCPVAQPVSHGTKTVELSSSLVRDQMIEWQKGGVLFLVWPLPQLSQVEMQGNSRSP